MELSVAKIQELRQRTGVGLMDAKSALTEASGDLDAAVQLLRRHGEKVSQKKVGRATTQGIVAAYVHANQRLAGVVSLCCETDFVARTESFQSLAHDLAMQIAGAHPVYIDEASVPPEVIAAETTLYREQLDDKKPASIQEKIIQGKLKKFFEEHCLMKQKFIKDDSVTIEQLIQQAIGKLGENIIIAAIGRYEI